MLARSDALSMIVKKLPVGVAKARPLFVLQVNGMKLGESR
jgi:hypothetical protein